MSTFTPAPAPPSSTVDGRPDANPNLTWKRLSNVLLRPQSLWFAGHVYLVISAAMFYMGYQNAYYRAWVGALVSYGIVVWKTHGLPKPSREYFSKATMDTNVQYMFMAFFFWLNYYITPTVLVPYVSFSLFHALSYLRDSIIPIFFPPATGQPSLSAFVMSRIHNFIQRYQPRTLTFMAYWEICICMPHLIIQTLMWRQSLFAPYAYAHFLRLRYHLSVTTQGSFGRLRRMVDGWVLGANGERGLQPNVMGKVWIKLRDLCIRFGESAAMRPQPQQPGPGRR